MLADYLHSLVRVSRRVAKNTQVQNLDGFANCKHNVPTARSTIVYLAKSPNMHTAINSRSCTYQHTIDGRLDNLDTPANPTHNNNTNNNHLQCSWSQLYHHHTGQQRIALHAVFQCSVSGNISLSFRSSFQLAFKVLVHYQTRSHI